jgi:signal transduction histidine kinase
MYEYMQHFDGVPHWFEARIVPTVHDETLVIVRDITDRKDAERHREETERMNILKELFDNLSHDLRTPIASIVTSIYLLRKQNEHILKHNGVLNARLDRLPSELNTLIRISTNEIQHAAERNLNHMNSLDESAWRLRRMVESMVDMARLDRALTEPHPVESFNRVVHRAVNMMQPLAAKKAIALHAEIDESLPETMVDDADFSRVVQNLIENAVNYTSDGGVVTVMTRRYDECVALEVRDNGIGISPEDLPNIFNRLYRADKARTSRGGGMGLGLAIVKRIVEAHHGTIEVESVLGAGSVFRICLPIERAGGAP